MTADLTHSFIEPYVDLTKAARLYRRLFCGREDAHALQHRDGSYHRVCEPVTEDLMQKHLTAKVTVGLYLVTPVKNTCSMAVIDVDQRSRAMAEALINSCRKTGCEDSEYLLEASGNKGFHVWFFLDHARPAWTAIRFAETVCREADVFGQVEIFPKQQRVPEGGYGNPIKLPGLHRKSGRYSRFFGPDIRPVGFPVLETVRPVPASVFSRAVEQARQQVKRYRAPVYRRAADVDGELPCIAKICQGVDKGRRNTSGFILAVHLKRCGLPAELVQSSLAAWNRRNRPPLGDSELRAIAGGALRPQYPGFSCSSPDVQPFCNTSSCPRGRVNCG